MPGPPHSGSRPADSAVQAEREQERERRLEERIEAVEQRLDDLKGSVEQRRARLAEKLRRMRESWNARRAAEQARLKSRWGDLSRRPEVRAELRRHAWTMARLNRLRLLSAAEDRPDLVSRVEALIAKENARHERRMQELCGPLPPASASQGGKS